MTNKEKVQQVRSTLELVAFTHFTSDYGLHVIIEGSHSFDMDVELVAMACRSAKCPHLTRY